MAQGFDFDGPQGVFSYGGNNLNKAFMQVRAILSSTDLTVVNNIAGKVLMDFAGNLISGRLILDSSGTTGNSIVHVINGTSNVFSTQLQVDTGEADSNDSVVTPVIANSAFAVGDIITFNVTEVQTSPPPKGLLVSLIFERTL